MSLRSARMLADVSLLAVVAGWGYMFVPVKQATTAWPSHCLTFVAVRFWIATAAFLPVLALAPTAPVLRPGPSLRAGVGAGSLMLLGYAFQTLGLRSTSAAVGAFITSLNVVFVPIGARLLGHRVSASAFVGVAIASVGLAVLCLGGGGGADSPGFGTGEALVLLCAVSFAGQILLTDRQARRVDPIWFTFSQCAVTAVGATIAACVFEARVHGWPAFDVGVFGAAAFCGVVGSTVSFTAQTMAQRITPATHVALIFASEPVFGALFAHALLREELTASMLGGAGLILAGIGCSEVGALLRGRRRSRSETGTARREP
ncbi:MAG: DMT family transporter [Planctomycetota bacterium]